MSASDINAEIRDIVNRDEITEAMVYRFMSRAAQMAQTRSVNPMTGKWAPGSMLDFMRAALIALPASGNGTPGETNSFRSGKSSILLPPQFQQLIRVAVMTDDYLPNSSIPRIWDPSSVPVANAPDLWWFPSQASNTSDGTTVDASPTLYPFFGDDTAFIERELAARGIPFHFTGDTLDFAEVLSKETGSFAQDRDTDTTTLRCYVSGTRAYSRYADVASAMTSAGYADGPWGGKVLYFDNLDEFFDNDAWPFVIVECYRTLPAYNEPDPWTLKAPTAIGDDIFSRTAPELLIYGSLSLAYRYLQEERLEGFNEEKFKDEVTGFRMNHMAAQAMGPRATNTTLRRGTRVKRI